LGTGSVIPALTAAEVCQLLVLLIKGIFSQDVLVDWLAVLSDLFNGNREVEYVKGVVMMKVIPQISNSPRGGLQMMGVIKVRLVIWCVLLSETRVTSTNQSSVFSEIGHSCVQTSRHWGGN